ncbi:choice-of-anchor J family PEP-CTERM protein [Pelomonas sp. BJYL3]|uniref:choice-of-anchor J family PEP-CTERM protein n=1 Tax=Pelomonas sp. BJYL3 TaxID=2976697 RepID=UPI0022B32286|nr:choice-of-anchor J domain-containing protein [Pelomonas sp. BJYL3]
MRKQVLSVLALSAAMASAQAGTLLSEGFDNVGGLAAQGWVFTNNSLNPQNKWLQGADGVFAPQAGGPTSYATATYNSAKPAGGAIENWLITKTFSLSQSFQLSFYANAKADGFIDQLDVMLSTNGSASATGNFTHLLVSINPTGDVNGAPYGWTRYTATFDGLGGSASGRLAFVYKGDYETADAIALDTLDVSTVPEPASYALIALGLVGAAVAQRRRKA